MAADRLRHRVRWLALHGVVRALSAVGTRRGGDPQARLIADPAVRANPAAFADELRGRGPLVRCRAVYMTFDHAVANELLRSDDFRVSALGAGLPAPLRWINEKTDPGSAAPDRAAVAVVDRTARPHPLPQAGVLGVHHPGRRRVARRRAADRRRPARPTRLRHRRRRRGGPVLLPTAGRGDQRHPRCPRSRPAADPAFRRARRTQPRHRLVVAPVHAGASRASPGSTTGWAGTWSTCAAIPATT